MAFEVSERVKRMKENYIRLHEEGKTIAEIAKLFNISIWSVYDHLQEIADDHKVTRESLLKFPNKAHNITRSSNIISNKIDFEKFREECSGAILQIEEARKQINDYLKNDMEEQQ